MLFTRPRRELYPWKRKWRYISLQTGQMRKIDRLWIHSLRSCLRNAVWLEPFCIHVCRSERRPGGPRAPSPNVWLKCDTASPAQDLFPVDVGSHPRRDPHHSHCCCPCLSRTLILSTRLWVSTLQLSTFFYFYCSESSTCSRENKRKNQESWFVVCDEHRPIKNQNLWWMCLDWQITTDYSCENRK